MLVKMKALHFFPNIGYYSPNDTESYLRTQIVTLEPDKILIKPVTPELNPSAQRILTRFFTGLLFEPCISLIYA
jgi:hypothetical protein